MTEKANPLSYLQILHLSYRSLAEPWEGSNQGLAWGLHRTGFRKQEKCSCEHKELTLNMYVEKKNLEKIILKNYTEQSHVLNLHQQRQIRIWPMHLERRGED